MIIIIVLTGGLFFLYLTFKCMVKINIAFYFFRIYFCLLIFGKKLKYERRIDYSAAIKALDGYREPEARTKAKNSLKHYKYLKKAFDLFCIRDIFFYPESLGGKESFAFEFVVVNRILKKSLLKG